MIILTGISKWYQANNKVLDQINLTLQKGDFLYVVGGSGAGKSSLLRLIATEELPSEGVISLFGYDLNRISQSTLRAIRQVIGYIPQDIRLIPDLTVFDNVALSLTLAGKRVLDHKHRERISELLMVLGLIAKKDVLCRRLSGGEAQRVAIARALARSPELIIADEPTGAQDRDFTWSLMELLVKTNTKGTTVIVATHDQEIVRRVRRRCALIKGGHVSFEENLCFF